MNKKKLELYLHIPFCVRKCAYCDFLSFAAPERMYREYVDKLIEEIYGQSENFREYQVVSIFVGGGTPSLLPASLMEELFAVLHQCFDIEADAEITIEANPGTLTMEKLELYRQSGVNRLSLGLQSADDQELNYLGRIHTYEDFLKSYQRARQAGFTNINVDLMSALPGQDLHSWKTTLRKVLMLKPEHISAYSLIIEEGTPFCQLFGEDGDAAEEKKRRQSLGIPELPDEDAERRMYYDTERILGEAGYHRYEISNYAKPGYECRHNKGYWTGTEYLGLGLGASSYINIRREKGEAAKISASGKESGDRRQLERRSNVRDFKTYLSLTREDFRAGRQIEERDLLTSQAQMEEFMFLGLRLTEGISEAEFLRRFSCALETVYGDVLEELARQELMERYEREGAAFWRLTKRGIDVSNCVLAEFLME